MNRVSPRPIDLRIAPYFDTLFTPELKSYQNLFDALQDPAGHGLAGPEAGLLAEAIHDYLIAHPPTPERPRVRDVQGWEDWTLSRALAILAYAAEENRLRENPTIAALRREAMRYLAGTGRLSGEAG